MSWQKISLTANALDADSRRAAVMSRSLGFSGLLFDAYGSVLRIPDLSVTGRREFIHTLTAQNQELVGLQGELGPKGFGPGADVDRLVEGIGKAMEAARGLGSPMVCIDVGPLPEPVREIKAKPVVTAEQAGLILLPEAVTPAPSRPVTQSPPPDPVFVAQVDGALGALGAMADQYSCVVALRSELSSFAALAEAMNRVRCPWFGVDLDPVAILRDEWPVDEVFSRMGQLIRHVRGKDAVKGADRRTKPAVMGRGDVNWQGIIGALHEAAYAGWVSVDPVELADREAAARAAVAWLRKK